MAVPLRRSLLFLLKTEVISRESIILRVTVNVMSDILRRFLTHLSPESSRRFLSTVDLVVPDAPEEKASETIKRRIEAVAASGTAARGRLQAIAGHVLAVYSKGDLAEQALRHVCRGQQNLIEILESERSFPDRIYCVWCDDATALDKARNLAMSYHWRGGRYHCAFKTRSTGVELVNASAAIDAIRDLVQGLKGGRRVHMDQFVYINDTDNATVHHIAVYLESPASLLLEFQDGDEIPQPVLHREAKEIAVDYKPSTGQLDVAGRGTGGFAVFHKIAQALGSKALDNTEVVEIARSHWDLEAAFADRSLSPPSPFSAARITEVTSASLNASGSKLTVRAGAEQNIYDRFQELGLGKEGRVAERFRSITITLECPPQKSADSSRQVRVTISLPNAKSFEGASLKDREVIEAWLAGAPFIS